MINKVFATSFTEKYNNVSNNNKNGIWSAGYYWDKDFIFIKKDDADLLNTVIKTIANQKPTPIKPGDTIYASKVSEIPRFKLKEFIKENKLKKTSRKTKAKHIIINKGYFEALLNDENLKISDYIFLNDNFINKEIYDKIGIQEKNKYNEAEDKDMVAFLRADILEQTLTLLEKYKAKFSIQNNTSIISGILLDLYRQTKYLELLNILIDNKNEILSGEVNIIFDELLFEELNKDGIELDDEYLTILKDMLFSKDDNNVKLGFEMMSNLVINQPTLLSIAFLLNELYNNHYFRPSKYTQSNSNLRSLLKLYKTKKIRWESNWKVFGTGLRLNFKDGKEGEIVKKFLLDNINREFKLSNQASESLVDIVFATETN